MSRLLLLIALAPAVFAQDFDAIDRLIQSNLPLLSSGAALLLDVGGQPLYSRAYGRFTLSTAVPIASATKWISGAVVMAAVDEGKLPLDDRAGKWLPEFNTGAKAAITVRQLFSHTSGLPGGDGGCLGDIRTTLAACAQQIAGYPLIHPPGEAFYYGGNSMQVAGRIVEVATGVSFTTYYRQKIAGPLEFSNCTYNSETNPRIAGGLECTAPDYLKFVRMIRDGGLFQGRVILSRAATDEMLRDQTGGVPILFSPFENYRYLAPLRQRLLRLGPQPLRANGADGRRDLLAGCLERYKLHLRRLAPGQPYVPATAAAFHHHAREIARLLHLQDLVPVALIVDLLAVHGEDAVAAVDASLVGG